MVLSLAPTCQPKAPHGFRWCKTNIARPDWNVPPGLQQARCVDLYANDMHRHAKIKQRLRVRLILLERNPIRKP